MTVNGAVTREYTYRLQRVGKNQVISNTWTPSISVTDQAENVVEYTYDAANQLQTVVQVNSPNTSANTTVVGYDADGNPITLEDANTHSTASSFDLLGELTGKTLPDGSLTETRNYDTAGNLTSLDALQRRHHHVHLRHAQPPARAAPRPARPRSASPTLPPASTPPRPTPAEPPRILTTTWTG